jgi:hypothetical protein
MYKLGQRIKIHPATDAWMQGDRYGVVVKVGRDLVHVRCDASGRVRKFSIVAELVEPL